jgi:hypothetical protein
MILAWYRVGNTVPRFRFNARLSCFAALISNPCIPLASACLLSASAIKWM